VPRPGSGLARTSRTDQWLAHGVRRRGIERTRTEMTGSASNPKAEEAQFDIERGVPC